MLSSFLSSHPYFTLVALSFLAGGFILNIVLFIRDIVRYDKSCEVNDNAEG